MAAILAACLAGCCGVVNAMSPAMLLASAGTATVSTAVVLAPAFCAGALGAWTWAALPECGGEAARVSRILWRTLYTSLLVLCMVALVSNGSARVALLVYTGVGFVPLCSALFGRTARRILRNIIYLTPVVLHYLALDKWAEYTHMPKEHMQEHRQALDNKYASWIFSLIVNQGGLYVKIGQILSLFPKGSLPEAYHCQFRRLQAEVTALPSSQVRDILVRTFGRPLNDIFCDFDDEPLGAASIGQVHRARLASDGQEVVVKVQYPDVARGVWADFFLFKTLVRTFKPKLMVHMHHPKAWLEKELDFQREARALQRIHASLWKAFPRITVPVPVEELCTKQVIVMTFIPGVSVLQVALRMAALVLGGTAARNLEGLAEWDSQPAAGAPQAPAGGQAAAVAAALLAPIALAWRHRTLARTVRRGLAVSGFALALTAVVHGWREQRALGTCTPVLRITLLRVLQRAIAASRTATNVGIALYNQVARCMGASQLKYRSSIPKVDPVETAVLIWKVQGHQLFADGFFNSDAHPGNFLVDDRTGKLGLLDFGQACELALELRVLIARQVVALAEGTEHEIALRHAQLGCRTTRMTSQSLAMNARVKYGSLTMAGLGPLLGFSEFMKRWDPVITDPCDVHGDLAMVERMFMLLRGTTAMLGAPLDFCCAPVLWLPAARALLVEHGQDFPEVAFELSSERPATVLDHAGVAAPKKKDPMHHISPT
mmetsp:Transcript_25555/g.73787  ORF Transcript_25555/g.73787 Transcript_25555/m.73787 type:complete len:718 (+) Transcript_25555:39-2192(+)